MIFQDPIRNTDTLLKIHPVEFGVLSEELLRFSRVSVWIWVQPNQFSPEIQISDYQNWGQNSCIFADFFYKSPSCPQNWQHGQTDKLTTLERNRKLLQKALGKLRGASWRVHSRGVFDRVKRVFSAKKLSSWSPKIISHNRWSSSWNPSGSQVY